VSVANRMPARMPVRRLLAHALEDGFGSMTAVIATR